MGKLTYKVALVLLTFTFFFSSSVAPALAAITYLYDANGNLTSDGSKCYEYNQENQLVKVKTCSNSQTIAEYVYDYQGNRLVKKTYANGVLQKTTYSPTDSYETVKLASGTTQNTSYYFANDELVAKKNPDGSKNYFLNDHLGSDSVQTDQNGAALETTQYDPWGEVLAGGTKNKFQYTGQEKDSETGLNYYNARYYDAHSRHFTQADTLLADAYDPQQLNRYAYVRNNPVSYTDPSGRCIWDLCIIEGIGLVELGALAVGAVVAYQASTHPSQTYDAIRSTPSALGQLTHNATTNITNLGKAIANAVSNTKPGASNPPISINKGTPPSGGSSQRPNLDPLQKIGPVIPPAATTIADRIKENGGRVIDGYKSGVFENREGLLPKAGEYIEHDIVPFVQGVNRGAQRVVIDTATGKAWYTSDHYKTFQAIPE